MLRASTSVESVAQLIARGDQARDRRDWPLAADAYERALERSPDLAPIWVQLGHARKEGGDPEAAETAYQTAMRLDPENADTQLQLGHLMKIMGKKEVARSYYSRAATAELTRRHALDELRALGATWDDLVALSEEAPPSAAKRLIDGAPAVYLDVTSVWRAGGIDARSAMTALWTWRIACALHQSQVAQPVAVDSDGGLLALDIDDGRLVERGMVLAEDARGPASRGECAGLAVLGLFADSALMEETWSALRRAARLQPLRLVGLFPELARPVEDLPGGRQIKLAFAAEMSAVVTSTGEAMGVHWRGARTKAERNPKVIRLRPTVPRCAGPPLDRSTVTIDQLLCLAPRISAEEAQISAGWARSRRDAALTFADDGLVDRIAERDALAHVAYKPSAGLLIPASRDDLDLWVGAAHALGIPVVCSSRSAAYATWGDTVAYVDTFEASAVRDWLDGDRVAPAFRNDGLSWADALADRLRDKRFWIGVRPIVSPAPEPGRFNAFGVDPHNACQSAARRAILDPLSVQIDETGAKLLGGSTTLILRLSDVWPGRHRVQLLVASAGAGRVSFKSWGSEECASKTFAAPGRGWLTVDVEPPGLQKGPWDARLEVAVTSDEIRLLGFAVYPLAEDRLWFEMLDRASHGLEPGLGPAVWP